MLRILFDLVLVCPNRYYGHRSCVQDEGPQVSLSRYASVNFSQGHHYATTLKYKKKWKMGAIVWPVELLPCRPVRLWLP